MLWSALAVLLVASAVRAQVKFKPPSKGPFVPSPNYGGPSNTTLPKPKIVPGKVFDRFMQVWLENTDFEVAAGSPVFQKLAKKGVLLTEYYAVTHPSEPNYVATVAGDFWGMADDNFYNIPSDIATIVDLLEAKDVSWASYQESMATDGDPNFNELMPNYLNASAPPHAFWVRKHDPLIIYDSVASVPSRAALVRNFNDFAADYHASAIPQWTFVTPNMVNDGHDTDIDFIDKWLEFWFLPLLENEHFNNHRTLISLTFDENEERAENNRVMHLLLGGAIPKKLRGTTDATFFTHYSALSTVELNWGLGCLGRNDVNKTLSNVYSFVADATGYKNLDIAAEQIPLLNASGTTPGPLNSKLPAPFPTPDASAACPGGGSVLVTPS